MRKRFLLLLPVLLIGIIAFVVSCVRNQDAYWDSSDLKAQRPLTVADAQSWFEKEYSDDITVVRSVQNGNSTRMVSYAESVFAGTPDWATARVFRKNSNSLIVTLDYLDPKTNYRGFRDIIIVRNHKTKSFNAFVQLQLFDTAYLNNQKRIKGERANIREYSDPATFTGKVYKYSINNEFIRGAIYKNGKMVARVFPKNKISSFFNSPGSSTVKKSYVPYNGVANLGRAPGAKVSKAVALHSRSVTPSYEEAPVRMSYGGGDDTDTDEYDTHDPDSNMETVVVTAVDSGTESDTGDCDPLWGDTCDGSGGDEGGDPYPTEPCNCGGGGGGGSGNVGSGEAVPPTEVPTFILSRVDQKTYPRLTQMVKK
ncbi:hypothetical protein [Niabella ginsengisoli]|uniref:Uncharacterized protein n=1 Tax=Niabella ginsengisoli TaxID=522298 RepID=A0ABS9SMA3_9BACT|nr:hypothetical protein [Niabella ginsengisoli]MCH5599499.1 hypothetical protein [Niabella ginsengisoli]